MDLSGAAMRLARLPFGGWLVGLGVERWAGRLPVDVVYRDERVIAFHHPSTVYTTHVLIVPRKRIGTLLDFNQPDRVAYLGDVLRATHEVLMELGLWFDFVTLLVNGGLRQEVRQVHFHLITGAILVASLPDEASPDSVLRTQQVVVAEHPSPNWETHLTIRLRRQLSLPGALANPPIHDLSAMLGVLPELDRRYALVRRGYSVCIQGRSEEERRQLTFHVISGERLDSDMAG